MYNHILLEVFCTKEYDENLHKETPDFCKSKNYVPQYDCLFHHCPFVTFTSHENTLCYINDKTEAEEIISLGEEMIPADSKYEKAKLLWQKVSIGKINEAYKTYVAEMNSQENMPSYGDGDISEVR